MAQGHLKNIISRSFPSAHLLEISLVQDQDPDLPFYKNRFFFFLALTPGQGGQNGRTFVKENKIILKTEVEKILALSESINFWVKGHGPGFGTFSIFVDGSKSVYGGGVKSISVSDWNPTANMKVNPPVLGNPAKRQIGISFKAGKNKPIGILLSPCEALAIAHIFKKMADKALDMEMQLKVNTVGPAQPNPTHRQQPRQEYQQPSRRQQPRQEYQQPSRQQQPSQAPQGPPQNQQTNQPTSTNSTEQVINDFQAGMNAVMNNQGPMEPPPGFNQDDISF